MDKQRELWWILWGIFVAFLIQVLYDGFGLYFGQQVQFTLGLATAFIFFIVLIVFAKRILSKKKNENATEKRLNDREFQLELAEIQGLSDSTNSFLTTMIAVGITWIATLFTLSFVNALKPEAVVSLLESASIMLLVIMGIALIFIGFNYGYIPSRWRKLQRQAKVEDSST